MASRHDPQQPLEIHHGELRAEKMGSHGSLLPVLCGEFVAAHSSQARLISQGYYLRNIKEPWRRTGDADTRTFGYAITPVHPKTRDVMRYQWTYEFRCISIGTTLVVFRQ